MTDIRRSRSNTSMSTKSNRPHSRASTASVHSFEQFHHPQPSRASHLSPQPHDHAFTTSEALQPALIQAAHQASAQDHLMNMSLESVQQYLGYPANSTANQPHQNGLPAQPDHHAYHNSMSQHSQQHNFMAPPMDLEDKKKKSSALGAATNDKELRQLLKQNENRLLKDVAAEVIQNDKTSKSEKSKQLFAMLWLQSVCRIAKTSVPRNRVYSKYADRCTDDRVIPLNPASFGKLVRVIFPGIQTRRLGVRGESKYHYVDLELVPEGGDSEEPRRHSNGPAAHHAMKRQPSAGPRLNLDAIPRLHADTAPFPPQNPRVESSSSHYAPASSRGVLFIDIYSEHFRPAHTRTRTSYEHVLQFPMPDLLEAPDALVVELPDINPYLPERTDPDSAQNLVAMYRSHVVSMVDSVRYCKEKQFFRLFGTFHGTLTVPVQKLFANPDLAPWIKECDWIMYQKMIRNVSQLTLQVAPPPVLKFLDNVAKTLHAHITAKFQSLPVHVLEAKLEPATLFAHLLRQMLRVNSAAHAAAVMLTAEGHRIQMFADWVQHVNIKRIVANELPGSCSHEDVYNLLSTEMRSILGPLPPEIYLPSGLTHRTGYPDPLVDPSESVIDRIAAFLTRLPSQFPGADARTILHCISALGSAALREITVENGVSFQGWWLTKVFVDEMAQWLASIGGFLSHTPPNWDSPTYSPVMGDPLNAGMTNGGSGSNNDGSRYSSLEADFGPDQSFMSNASNNVVIQDARSNQEVNTGSFAQHPPHDTMSFGYDYDMTTSQQEPNHDDSGIGLGLGVQEDGIDAKFASHLSSALSQSVD
ncbi:cephalosporin C regulator 1 [Decorospora gaudefroyi]|uniref:Cephalosporin C regulator 1 n=1 Tax=Decorospora gaudefroyi TaxID=184978 RepID=A0A6A5KBA8_9PLEO|nr:cephalosporin C regulator 1 [Decorospora gaudefroyi]